MGLHGLLQGQFYLFLPFFYGEIFASSSFLRNYDSKTYLPKSTILCDITPYSQLKDSQHFKVP
jgi:hypothetical protein